MAEKNWTEPNRSPYEGEQTPLLVDAQGIPVNVILTKADRHDVTRLLPRIDGVPPIRGKRGWPLKKPKCLQADRAYDSRAHCRAGELMGVEALVPWQHPVHGIVSPLTFIPLDEESGLIVAVGEWVLKTACEQAVAWQEQCMPPLRMAVNLSAGQFHRNDFLTTLKTVLRDTGMPATSLELQITESMLMDDPDAAAAILQEIHVTGVQIAIDDFGTGYSSLSYLKRFPIHCLKIDRAFIRDLPDDRSDLAITRAIITLAQSLNMKVVAEGVETRAQQDMLMIEGCDEFQGFLFSKPSTAKEMEAFLPPTAPVQDKAGQLALPM